MAGKDTPPPLGCGDKTLNSIKQRLEEGEREDGGGGGLLKLTDTFSFPDLTHYKTDKTD